jgi:2-amino-4-hydroxy-6-hydroxymethyldihydropteridine diphosphokinase
MTDRETVEAGLGLGSNLGDRIANFHSAIEKLNQIPGVRVVDKSSLYETEPVGVKPEYQHLKFINAVVIVRCDVPVIDLHRACVAIEAEVGRSRSADRYAPRTLDIDVLYYGDLVQHSPKLCLPHPQCLKRRFVLEPLAEVRPHFIVPGTGSTTLALLAALPPGEQVVKLPARW